ncbi:hypothetical protein [Streptomyces dysideae]|uniref:Uncharacterized protein n=1 Tax=Streptomyces dysideae TaxID=909626 RepID=A0A124IDB2_9ACTN|nr:hypothetical protein [Streptomyces dysideae]KUO14571.1 hypothetical protein AQJ91_45960 [Streptomyces dysideae]
MRFHPTYGDDSLHSKRDCLPGVRHPGLGLLARGLSHQLGDRLPRDHQPGQHHPLCHRPRGQLGLHGALAAAGGARVVSVSSSGHLFSPVVFEDPHFIELRSTGPATGSRPTR